MPNGFLQVIKIYENNTSYKCLNFNIRKNLSYRVFLTEARYEKQIPFVIHFWLLWVYGNLFSM